MSILWMIFVFASCCAYSASSEETAEVKTIIQNYDNSKRHVKATELLPSEIDNIPTRVRRQAYHRQHNPQPYHTQYSRQYNPPPQQNQYHHVGGGPNYDGNSYNEDSGNSGSSQYGSEQGNAYGSEGGHEAGDSGGTRHQDSHDDGAEDGGSYNQSDGESDSDGDDHEGGHDVGGDEH